MQGLADEIRNCQKCPLAKLRVQAVPGEGPSNAGIFIIGEGPGELEDSSGRPFVGESGRVLNKFLALANLPRNGCYVTNIVKCRPRTEAYTNRKPTAKEIKACKAWLVAQLEAIKPRLIITLGDVPLKWFVPKGKLGDLHGKIVKSQAGEPQKFYGTLLLPMYHPAAVLWAPKLRSTVEQDFVNVTSELAILDYRPPPVDYRIVPAKEFAERYVPRLLGKEIGFDLETNSGDMHTCSVVGYAVAWADGQAVYVPDDPQLSAVRPLLEANPVVTHNGKFEYVICLRNGVVIRHLLDNKLAYYLLGYADTHLKALALQRLDRRMTKFSDLVGKGKAADMTQVPVELAAPYCCADADLTMQLHTLALPELKGQGLDKLYYEVELPLIPVLAQMQLDGVGIDKERLVYLGEKLKRRREKVAVHLVTVCPEAFGVNIMSHSQLAKLLYTTLKLPPQRYKGKLTTDKNALQKLVGRHPVISFIQSLRGIEKMLRTYVRGILAATWPDGTLHVQFNQSGAYKDDGEEGQAAPATGRLSSSDPINLQNIPRPDTVVGKEIREAFLPCTGHRFVDGAT